MTGEIRQLRFAAPPGACRLLLLRHGETTPVRDGVAVPLLEGQSNPDLDPVGIEEAQRAADRLAAEDVAAIYVTPLARTHQTAAPLVGRLGLEPAVEPRLIEIHLGDWEGGEYRRRMHERDPVAMQALMEERWDVIPGAESMESLGSRVAAGLDTMLAAIGPGGLGAAVLHGGVIGELCRQVTRSRPFAFIHADNCSLTRIVQFSVGHRLLRSFNDTAHLA